MCVAFLFCAETCVLFTSTVGGELCVKGFSVNVVCCNYVWHRLSAVFYSVATFNQDLSSWDVSSVINMEQSK